MTTSAAEPRELIPGYRATERLGAGGYGEVWKVEAPGGLLKAVKLVYGYVGDERAEREFKALHRIKEVRHPFVLSLERIEVIDGRLLIVTELAEMSLMDRFEKCVAGKQAGIPRGELLTYMRDAADALDYMLQSHSLQHLDVKPENLLIVGGRAKVADFGLVKELADQTRSMVGAMTPTYAAPELFDGRASDRCDQYSLAILYQELRTGILPFPGRTAAQLAAQHTQSPPQLGSLPPAERPIVARALAKRPQDRYGSCGEFVTALMAVEANPEPVQPHRPSKSPPSSDRDTGTLSMEDTRSAEAPGAPQVTEVMNARLSSRSIQVAPKPTMERPRIKVDVKVVDAPPPGVETLVGASEKTLLIGVGGTGMAVLGRLNRFLRERTSLSENQPNVQFLAFDTDRQATRQAAVLGLDPDDVSLLRLRPASEYRADADALLKWIGRRWLYNIPKSELTDGLRPLGRLALVDHAGVVVSKLRRRLKSLLNEDEDQSAAETASPAVRVIVVGACSGGTGGGMLLEMAYAVQNVATQLGVSDVEVTALIAHATNRCKTGKQLAQANAYSFLSELQHYIRYGSLSPETTTPQAAIYESDRWPVRDLYFHHLGDDLDGQQYDAGVQQIAEYLFADVATGLGTALQACRTNPSHPASAAHDVLLRSMRTYVFAGVGSNVRGGIEQDLLHRVTGIWFANALDLFADQNDEFCSDDPTCMATIQAWEECLDALGPSNVGRLIRKKLARLAPTIPTGKPNPRQTEHPVTARLRDLCAQLADLKTDFGKDTPGLEALALAVSLPVRDLRGRLDGAAAAISEELLEAYTNFLDPQANEVDSVPTRPLPRVLFQEARGFTSALLHELFPSASLTEDGQMCPDVPLMIDELAARHAEPFGGTRRTIVLRSAESDIDEEVDQRLGRACGFVDGESAAVTICEELENISLAQVAHATVAGNSETRSVAARIHTRADIQWTEPALIECSS